MVDDDVRQEDQSSGAFGFDAQAYSSQQEPSRLLQTYEGLLGAFMRGVNYHLSSPSLMLKPLLASLQSYQPGLP